MHILKENLSISTMLFWRFLVSSVFMLIIFMFQLKTIRASMREMGKVLVFEAGFYSACSITYFMASTYLGTGLSMVIFFSYPAVVIFLNRILYRIPIQKMSYFAIGLIFLGIVLLVDLDEAAFDLMGILFGVATALLYAGYILASKKSQVSPISSALLLSIGCTVMCGLAALWDNSFAIPESGTAWINILGIGILCTALPILFLLAGLKRISSEKAAILSVLEPVVVVVVGILFLHEYITTLQVFGILTILSGAVITLFSPSVTK